MRRQIFDQRRKRTPFWAICGAVLLVILLTGNGWAASSAQKPAAGTTNAGEFRIVVRDLPR